MIKYRIDTTENEYHTIEGTVAHIAALKKLIYSKEVFTNCLGYIYTDAASDTSLCIAAVEEYGVFLGYKNNGSREEYLSLGDKNCLNELVDVWGDGLYVSQGLFISAELAWEGIGEFAKTGKLLKDIEWIETDKIAEEGNYLI